MRQHLRQQLGEPIEVLVPVVQVIDEADIRQLQLLDDRELILRLAEPAAVVVEGDRAADLGRFFGDRADAGRFGAIRCAPLLLGRLRRPLRRR